MKILYVYGEGDYEAVTWEQEQTDLKESVKTMWEKARAVTGTHEYYDEESGRSFDAYEFDYVDRRFIDFVRHNIQDYDDSKHQNFYIVD